MALQTNTNVSPYYDDWEENKNYHRVMFKAGYPVQARELTQSQTILQDQIEKLASKFLKNGEQVQPGEFSLINPAVYVRLSSITQGATVDDFVGYYEQEYHPGSNEVELINMGVLKEFRGLKLGSTLVNHAIASASRQNPRRMWVHTCSLDHKHALQNYKSKGFEIFKEEEIDFVA